MSKSLKYGAKIYLKSQTDSHSGRWLCGCRGDENKWVYTTDKKKEAKKMNNYKWEIWETPTTIGSGDIISGNKVFLKCLYEKDGMEDKWLTGGRGNESKEVYTKHGGTEFKDTFQWEILLSEESHNRPIYLNDNVYLALNLKGIPSLYLTGGRGHGNKEVYTQKNIDKISTFLWKIKEVKSI